MTSSSVARGSQRRSPAGAWLILGVLLLFSIAAPLNQFKVPPIMPVLIQALGITIGRAGLLMSVYALTGLVLALPAGLIFQRAGPRATGLLAGGSIVLGAGIGALSQDMTGLLIGRVIEGIGTSFMAVLAPAIIARRFVAEQRGTAMGVWSAWVPVGSTTMLVIAPALATAAGWRTLWWFGAAYAAIATGLYLACVGATAGSSATGPTGPRPAAPTTALRNRNIWLLAGAFGAFNAAVIGLGTYLPTFLSTQRGLELGSASLIAGLITFMTIFSAPAGGILSDRIGSRKKPYLIGLLAAIILLPSVGALHLPGLIALVALTGLVIGIIPTNIFAGAVEAAGDPEQSGAAMAVIMVGQNAGMLIGPLIYGALVEAAGWPAAFAGLAIIAVLGLAAGWLAQVR